MKILVTFLIMIFVSYLPADKSLRAILKDGHFQKLPKTAKIIGHEVITDQKKRYGYLVFEGPSDDLVKWITKSKLVLTSKEEIFNKDIIVWPTKRPTWFNDSSNKFATRDIYYSKREIDGFTTLCWVDMDVNVIHLEYEIPD
jgi:hypothetical protein